MIPPFCDANGDGIRDQPFIKNMTYPRGSNHAGYYGFRDPTNHANLLYDGAINTVVRDWNSSLTPKKDTSTYPLSAKCNI